MVLNFALAASPVQGGGFVRIVKIVLALLVRLVWAGPSRLAAGAPPGGRRPRRVMDGFLDNPQKLGARNGTSRLLPPLIVIARALTGVGSQQQKIGQGG